MTRFRGGLIRSESADTDHRCSKEQRMVEPLHPTVAEVTARIEQRSRDLRGDYLAQLAAANAKGRTRGLV